MDDDVQDQLAAAEKALIEAQAALRAAKEADLASRHRHAAGVPMDEHSDPVRKFPRPKPRPEE